MLAFKLDLGSKWVIQSKQYLVPKPCPLLLYAAAKSLQSNPTLCDPIDGCPPGSPVPGILQARTLEWVAISFSNAWKWKVKVNSPSRVQLSATPWTAVHQAPPSMGFSRQEHWSGCHCLLRFCSINLSKSLNVSESPFSLQWKVLPVSELFLAVKDLAQVKVPYSTSTNVATFLFLLYWTCPHSTKFSSCLALTFPGYKV